MMKQYELIKYDKEVYTLKIYHYADKSIGVEIYDASGKELLHRESIREDTYPVRVEVRSAIPCEHIDEENEETYFYRAAGLYRVKLNYQCISAYQIQRESSF